MERPESNNPRGWKLPRNTSTRGCARQNADMGGKGKKGGGLSHLLLTWLSVGGGREEGDKSKAEGVEETSGFEL